MQFISKLASGIEPYTAGEQPRERFVKLNTNENAYPPSPLVKRAIESFDADTLNLYPRPDSATLRAEIARAEGVLPENVFVGNGSDEVLALSFPAFFDRDGKGVCIGKYTYSFYEVFAKLFGVPIHKIALNEDLSINLAGMCGDDCAGYLIANPNAPTGVGIGQTKMLEFVKSVPDRLVIADEAYMDFFGESLAPYVNRFKNLLVVKTFSKSYSLAGIRCGYAIGDPALISALTRIKDCFNSYPVDSLCSAVCIAALRDREYHRKTVEATVKERERLCAELKKSGLFVPESSANFLFVKIKNAGEVYRKLKARGVLVRYWDKPFLSDFLRITVGLREENDVLLRELNKLL